MNGMHSNPDEQARRELAVSLVGGAVEAAGKLDPESQALLLNEAGRAISFIDTEKAKGFWEAAFRLSQQMEAAPPSLVQWQTQLSVVTHYAHVDVDRAVELLRAMDPPVKGEPLDHDPRGKAAFVVVNCLIERHAEGDLDKGRATIAYVADTGEYPYTSAARLVEAFHRMGHDSRATEVFTEALGHFQQDARFRHSLEAFIGLILSSDGKVPDHLLTDGIRLALAEARHRDEEAIKQMGRKPPTYVLPSLEKGLLRFRTPSTCTAFRLVPLVRRLDAQLARQMEEGDAELRALLGQMKPEDVAARSAYTPQEVSSTEDEARLGPPLSLNQTMGTVRSILQSVYPTRKSRRQV